MNTRPSAYDAGRLSTRSAKSSEATMGDEQTEDEQRGGRRMRPREHAGHLRRDSNSPV